MAAYEKMNSIWCYKILFCYELWNSDLSAFFNDSSIILI